MSDTPRDRRSSPRISTTRRVWCEGDTVTLYVQFANISTGGAFLKTFTPLSEGDRARLVWKGEGDREIVANAEVVWVRSAPRNPTSAPPDGLPGMGLRFVDFEAGQEAFEVLLRGRF